MERGTRRRPARSASDAGRPSAPGRARRSSRPREWATMNHGGTPAADERADHRPGRGADDEVGAARVPAGLARERMEAAGEPGAAEHSARAEHQPDLHDGSGARWGDGPNEADGGFMRTTSLFSQAVDRATTWARAPTLSTLRHVTGPLKKLPQVTWPVGFSPLGPLWALTSKAPPQKLEVPLPRHGSGVESRSGGPGTFWPGCSRRRVVTYATQSPWLVKNPNVRQFSLLHCSARVGPG